MREVDDTQDVVKRFDRQRGEQQPRHIRAIAGATDLFDEDHVVSHRRQMGLRVRRLDLHLEHASFQVGLTRGTLRCRTEFNGSCAEQLRAAHFVADFDIRRRTRGGIALRRAAVFLGAKDVVRARTGVLLSFDKDVVDVRLAIGDAHDPRLRTLRRQLARQPIPFESTKALLLFNGQRATFVRLAETLRRAIEELRPDHPQPHKFEFGK